MSKKMLIVEDFKGFNNQLKKILQPLGYEIKQAFSLKEANELLANESFDYIILDLILIDGDGDEIVYQNNYSIKSKIIVLTSDVDVQRREMLFEHGILDYISKTNSYDYIISELKEILQNQELNRGKKILIIDDSAFIRKHISSLLEIRNYSVTTASNGKDALDILEHQKDFNLVILDLEMPLIDGEKVLREIRKKREFINLPVLVLSGTVDKELISRVLKHGASDYMKKPFSIEELILRIKLLIGYYEARVKLEKLNLTMKDEIEREVKKFQEQERVMMQQSRLAAMGEMIGNIAHQWRQPLNALSLVINKIEVALSYNKLTPEFIKDSISKANSIIQKMSQTIDDFRNFFKPNKEKQLFSLKEAIENVLYLLDGVFLSQNIKIIKNIDLDCQIWGYPNEFQQVLVAILSNAKDAIVAKYKKDGGVITISLEIIDNKVYLSIIDNGGGVPEEILPKIFDPYFTTKKESGTGIGLYMSKRIIEGSMGGSLNVTNTQDGACFEIVLNLD